jgi:hypothetical protein
MASRGRYRFAQFISALTFASTCVLASAFAQDNPSSAPDKSQTEEINKEILDGLAKAPATLLDAGMINLRITLMALFLVNKPKIFERDSFYFFTVDYVSMGRRIVIGVGYKSDSNDKAALIDECKDNINLIMSGLTRRVSQSVNNLTHEADAEGFACNAGDFYGKFGSSLNLLEVSHPDWNICKSIHITNIVRANDDKSGVVCTKAFQDKDVKIHTD